MVIKRHSHTAILIVNKGGELKGGEWIPADTAHTFVVGQYYPENSGSMRKSNEHGEEFIIRGEFHTSARKIPGAERIQINSIGLDERIQVWEQYQTHSVIYI